MWAALGIFRKDNCSKTKPKLSAYMDRRLNPQELAEVERHLANCHSCQKELDCLETTVALLHRLPQVLPSRSFRIAQVEPSSRRTAVPLLRLATAAAAVMLVMAFTADLTNLFPTSPSSLDQEGGPSATSYWRDIDGKDAESPTAENQTDSGQISSDNASDGPGSEEDLEATEAGWVRPLEYGLAGLVILLGGVTSGLWLKSKGSEKQRRN